MNPKLITLAICLGTTLQVLAQNNNSTATGVAAKANLQAVQNNVGITRTYDDRYEGSKGSPFLIDKFVNTKLVLNGNVILENIAVKYNVYDNTIVYKDAKGNLLAIGTNQVDQLIYNEPITGAAVVLQKLEGMSSVNQKAADKLVAFLFEGNKTKFAVLPIKELLKADFKGSSYSSGRTYDEFFDKTEFYFKGVNGSIAKVKLNKKNLLSSLADKETEIKSFISKEKIDASTEEGWIKVLTYYETI